MRELYVPPFLNRPLTRYELGRIKNPQNKDQCCSSCCEENNEQNGQDRKGDSNKSPRDLSNPIDSRQYDINRNCDEDRTEEFPFCCPNCGGTKTFFEAITHDNLLMSLRRSLGVPGEYLYMKLYVYDFSDLLSRTVVVLYGGS